MNLNKMPDNNRLEKGISIFLINLTMLEVTLTIIAFALREVVKDPLDFLFKDGGLPHDWVTTASLFFQDGLILVVIVSFGLFALYIWLINWGYTVWNKKRNPYIRLVNDSIILFGESRIPWSSISYIRSVERSKRSSRGRFLILGLSEELQHNRGSIKNFDRLIENNEKARSLYFSEYNITLDHIEFFSVNLDFYYGQTQPFKKIIALVESYWSSAPNILQAGFKEELNRNEFNPAIEKQMHFMSTGVMRLNFELLCRSLVLSVILIAFLFSVFPGLLAVFKKESARADWPSVNGMTILSEAVAGCASSSEYWPHVKYKYSVGDVEYVGSKINGVDLDLRERMNFKAPNGNHLHSDSPIIANGCRSGNAVSKVTSEYPVGAPVPVYFNPVAPEEAILVRTGVSVSTWVEIAAVFATCVGFVFAILIYAWTALIGSLK
jgi:hypothetical protein